MIGKVTTILGDAGRQHRRHGRRQEPEGEAALMAISTDDAGPGRRSSTRSRPGRRRDARATRSTLDWRARVASDRRASAAAVSAWRRGGRRRRRRRRRRSSGRRGCGRSCRRRARGRCRSRASPSPGATAGTRRRPGSTQRGSSAAGATRRRSVSTLRRPGGRGPAGTGTAPSPRSTPPVSGRRARQVRAQTAYAPPAISPRDDPSSQQLAHCGSLAHRRPMTLTTRAPVWQTDRVL